MPTHSSNCYVMLLFDTLMPRSTALYLMPEFSSRRVLVQWSMGLLLSLETSYVKGWICDPSSFFQVGNA